MATDGSKSCARCALVLAAACLTHATVGAADEIGIFGLLGAYNSSNPERQSSGGRRDNVGYATISTYGAWQSGRLTSHWDLAESVLSYVHSSFGTKNYGNVEFNATYDVIPKIFGWRLVENYGQLVSNPTEPDTPLNRGNFNVFSTGPTLKIPLGMRTFIESNALYTHTYYELGTLSGDTTDMEAGINRSLVPQTSLGVFVGGNRGSTEEFGRFSTQRTSLRLVAAGAWTKVVANVGINRAERPIRTGNLPFYDLSVVRTRSTASKWELTVSRALTNASQEFGVFSTGTGTGGAAPGNALNLNTSTSLFDATLVRASFMTRPRRTEWQGGLSWRKEDPLEGFPGEHRRYATLDASYYRVWGAKTGIRFYGAYGFTRGLQRADQLDHQTLIGCELAKPINNNPALRWVATLERSTRSSTDSAMQFQEIRIGFYLRYSKFVYQKQ